MLKLRADGIRVTQDPNIMRGLIQIHTWLSDIVKQLELALPRTVSVKAFERYFHTRDEGAPSGYWCAL